MMPMSMYRVLIIDHLQTSYLDKLDVECNVFGEEACVELCLVADESKIDGRLEHADLVISGHRIPLSERSFNRMQGCRGVVRAAVGYDNIDLVAARNRGIPVATVPDYGTEEVADHAIT